MKLCHAVILLFGICSSQTVAGQIATTQMNGGGFTANFYSGGRIGAHPATFANGYQVPSNSNTSPLYSSGLWFSGTTSDGQQRAYGHLYGSPQYFSTGPLTTDGSAALPSSTAAAFNRFWNVTRDQIEAHIVFFNCQSDPGCDLEALFPNGYTIPNSFLQWPAMGNVEAGEATYLAPFVDFDEDGAYDPSNGDHPCLPGNQITYHIFNDRGSAQGSGGSMGLEVHMTAFSYFANNPNIHRTLFTHYRIINRSSTTYNNFRIGAFADFDLGCYTDDRISTDVSRSLLYVHNADDNDEPCATPGYGGQPPAFGIQVLQGPLLDPDGLDNTGTPVIAAYNGTGFGDAIIDNERYGLNGSMYYNGNGVPGTDDPSGSSQYYNYMQGLWADGMPLSYGGDGYGGNTPSAFAFPGSTDPSGVGTGGTPQASWPNTSSNDRKGLAIMGPVTMAPGAEQEILLAYVFGRADTGGAQQGVAALQQASDEVAALVDTIPGLGTFRNWCSSVSTNADSPEEEGTSLVVHPNPANDVVFLQTPPHLGSADMSILDSRGVLVKQALLSGSLVPVQIGDLAPGVYTLRWVANKVVRVGRFIKL